MIAAFYNVENVPRFHLRAHAFEQIERTKRIARALDKEDRRAQSAQNFVAKFCPIAHRAERISKANERVYFFLQRDVTSDPPAHALADQDGRAFVNMSILGERFAMRGNQLRLYFSSIAYILMHGLRRLALKDTELEHAQCTTIRLKLLKIGAQIQVTVRRVWIRMAEGYPYQDQFQQALDKLNLIPLLC